MTMRVVSGFPGVGKSTLVKRAGALGVHCMDSDSSTFSKDEFPENYLAHIDLHYRTRTGLMLVSSHEQVRNGMVSRVIPYLLVYPSLDCKQEYIDRYQERGSPEQFLKLLDLNWEPWIESCREQLGCSHRVLGPGQYLADAVSI